jgi:hypothetical protein
LSPAAAASFSRIDTYIVSKAWVSTDAQGVPVRTPFRRANPGSVSRRRLIVSRLSVVGNQQTRRLEVVQPSRLLPILISRAVRRCAQTITVALVLYRRHASSGAVRRSACISRGTYVLCPIITQASKSPPISMNTSTEISRSMLAAQGHHMSELDAAAWTAQQRRTPCSAPRLSESERPSLARPPSPTTRVARNASTRQNYSMCADPLIRSLSASTSVTLSPLAPRPILLGHHGPFSRRHDAHDYERPPNIYHKQGVSAPHFPNEPTPPKSPTMHQTGCSVIDWSLCAQDTPETHRRSRLPLFTI